jgi:hypothetical protein
VNIVGVPAVLARQIALERIDIAQGRSTRAAGCPCCTALFVAQNNHWTTSSVLRIFLLISSHSNSAEL